jgi:hypothetical protein
LCIWGPKFCAFEGDFGQFSGHQLSGASWGLHSGSYLPGELGHAVRSSGPLAQVIIWPYPFSPLTSLCVLTY